MDRRDELIKLLKNENQTALVKVIDEIVFLEEQLTELKKLPFIRVNPNNSAIQKPTPASKQYRELLQQYTNCVKVLLKATGTDTANEESPLRKWMKQYVDSR